MYHTVHTSVLSAMYQTVHGSVVNCSFWFKMQENFKDVFSRMKIEVQMSE